ncbi:MAG: hypothetical protein KF841_11920 [Phycisphaerae bacterium]|nr:hypothetical protein [Phycisphaerae bacterium]
MFPRMLVNILVCWMIAFCPLICGAETAAHAREHSQPESRHASHHHSGDCAAEQQQERGAPCSPHDCICTAAARAPKPIEAPPMELCNATSECYSTGIDEIRPTDRILTMDRSFHELIGLPTCVPLLI